MRIIELRYFLLHRLHRWVSLSHLLLHYFPWWKETEIVTVANGEVKKLAHFIMKIYFQSLNDSFLLYCLLIGKPWINLIIIVWKSRSEFCFPPFLWFQIDFLNILKCQAYDLLCLYLIIKCAVHTTIRLSYYLVFKSCFILMFIMHNVPFNL